MKSLFLLPILLGVTGALSAQTTTYGGGKKSLDRRESTWIAYFDQDQGRFVGGFAINYNKVAWQERYAAELDTILRGGVWRMGKHFWSTLDTNLPIDVGGVSVAPGYYYLGLSRDDDSDGAFRLAIIDAVKAQAARLDAFNVGDAEITYQPELSLERGDQFDQEDELTIYFSVERATPAVPYEERVVTDVGLTIAFGDVRLTAPVRVTPPAEAAASSVLPQER